jgi:hypothetical protein
VIPPLHPTPLKPEYSLCFNPQRLKSSRIILVIKEAYMAEKQVWGIHAGKSGEAHSLFS